MFKYGIIARKSCELDYRGSIKQLSRVPTMLSIRFFLFSKKKEKLLSLSIKALTISIEMQCINEQKKSKASNGNIFFKDKVSKKYILYSIFSKREKGNERLIARDISKLSRLRIDVNIYCLPISSNR